MVFKIIVLKNFTIFTRKHLCCIFIKLEKQIFQKATPANVFSCDHFEIKNSFFYITPPVAASKNGSTRKGSFKCMYLKRFDISNH